MRKTNPLPFIRTAAIAASALVAAGNLTASDWPQYRGPNHDGKSPEKLQLKQWPADGPKVLWRVKTPNGFSSFTVADGKAFTIVGPEIQGARREVLTAFDANTGRQLWRVLLGDGDYGHDGGNSGSRDNKGGDGPRSTPVYDNGNVYALSSELRLVCINATTGKGVWQKDILKEMNGVNIRWENAASPVIDGSLLFLAGGGPGKALMALDKTSGKVVWAGEDDTMTHSTPTVATLHNVRQVIFFTQKGLASLQADTGRVLWRYDFPFSVSTAMSPVVAGDIVFCSAGYGVGAGAVKVASGGGRFTASEIYRSRGHKFIANHWSTPIHHQGHLYGMFQFKEYGDGPIKCVDANTGDIKWEQEGFGPGNLIYVDGHFLALSDSGVLHLFKATPAGYQEVSKAHLLTGKCWSTPVISNGRIYIRSTTEAVCLDVTGRSVAAK